MNGVFLKSAFSPNDWIKDEKKEFCFLGRSNVGKSSLINALANKKIALTSKNPGRTQLANFYDFKKFRLVDLPGYGYASIDKKKKFQLSRIISEFFYLRTNLVAVFQICDLSTITDLDNMVCEQIKHRFKQYYVILNKSDKQNKSYFDNNFHKINAAFGLEKENFLCLSAKNNINISALADLLKKLSE